MRKKLLFFHYFLQVMKWTCPILAVITATGFSVMAREVSGQENLSQRISVHLDDLSLKAALKIIAKKADIGFAYSANDIPLHEKVTVNADNEPAGRVLNRLLQPVNLSYRLLAGKVLIEKTVIRSPASPADMSPPVIKGKVTDASTGQPLAGVSVMIKGTSNGTATAQDGTFELHDITDNAVLVFSFIGYTRQEQAVKERTYIEVALQQAVNELNEAVVIGYGTQKKVNLTGSIATLDMAEKAGQPITNVSNALHGVPGLFVNLGNSQPGVDRATIRIRGIGTLSSNDPLVLVDGVEYSMDELNPNDIASITVLKDASAAIYGSRAASGVILVTTKEGKGKSHTDYSYYYGVQQYTYLPDAIWDPIAYMKLKDTAEANEGKTALDYSADDIAEYQEGMKTDPFTYPANNWFDIALNNGTIQKHDLSFSGSADKYQYRLSIGYLNRNGIIFGPGNHERKYSLGLNASMQVSKRLKVGITLDGYYRDYTTPFYTDFWNYLMRTLPILTDTLKDGRYGNSWLRTPGRNNWENPRMIAYNGYAHKYVQRFLTTVFANYQLPFDITYHIKFGADKYDGLLKQFTPQMQTVNPKTGAITNWNSPSTAPRALNTDDNDLNIHFYNTLNWQHQFAGKHNAEVMVGASYDHFQNGTFSATMTGYLDATLTALDAGTDRLDISGNTTEDVLESYFGRLNYDYDGKYLLAATFRYDASGRFAPGRRWGFYPSASAGWRIDKEPFFASGTVDLLKLRASVGQLGNQAVALYSYENSINLGQNYTFGGTLVPGAAAIAYSDARTSWETTTDYDLGIDADLWKSRFSITVDAYKKRTTGILRTVNLPSQVGDLTGPKRNVGTVDNTGLEFTLIYRNNIGEFNYEFSGNVAYNSNKVVDLGGQILYNEGTNLSTITEAGHPIDAYYLYEAQGLFQNEKEVADHAVQSNNTRPGYIRYRDVNNDTLINGDDRVIINSSSIMPKYTFGFGINLSYKGLSLHAFFQGVAGIKVYPTANLAFPFNNGANATWEWLTDSWTPERPNARLPIVTESNYGGKENYQPSTFWLRDGSYLRLKNIQLGYALPDKWLQKVKVSKLSVFVNAENWVTFSKYKDFDPESIVNASTLYHYPMLKTISTGLNITF